MCWSCATIAAPMSPSTQLCKVICVTRVQKELGDRKSASIDFVRQLLPLPKMFCEVITSEYVHSGSADTRGSGTHKTNNDTEQRKQVSTPFSVFQYFCFSC